MRPSSKAALAVRRAASSDILDDVALTLKGFYCHFCRWAEPSSEEEHPANALWRSQPRSAEALLLKSCKGTSPSVSIRADGDCSCKSKQNLHNSAEWQILYISLHSLAANVLEYRINIMRNILRLQGIVTDTASGPLFKTTKTACQGYHPFADIQTPAMKSDWTHRQ